MARLPPYKTSLPLCGLTNGILASFISSEIFLLIFSFVLASKKYFDANFLVLFLLGQIYGPLPAAILGMIFGTTMGVIFDRIPKWLSIIQSEFLGFFLSLLFLIGLYKSLDMVGVIKSSDLLIMHDFIWFYYLFIMLFLISGAWVGKELSDCQRIKYSSA